MQVSLEAMRVHRQMTQEEAARALSVHRDTLRRWEKGQSAPTYDVLLKICDVYQCDIDDLFFCDRVR